MKAFGSGFLGCLGFGFAILVSLIIILSLGLSDAAEEDVCSLWSQFIEGEEEQAAYDAACLTLADEPETRPTGSTRAWNITGSGRELGAFEFAFVLEAENSSNRIYFGCDAEGRYIAFDDLPLSAMFDETVTSFIEIKNSLRPYTGRKNEDLLIYRDSALIDALVQHNDEVNVYIDRSASDAEQRKGEREFETRGIAVVYEWLPLFCEIIGNPF